MFAASSVLLTLYYDIEFSLINFIVKLFDHIAACLAKFVEDFELTKLETKLPLGFTFSFPCQQEGLTSAILVNWTKGFNVCVSIF